MRTNPVIFVALVFVITLGALTTPDPLGSHPVFGPFVWSARVATLAWLHYCVRRARLARVHVDAR